MMNARSEQTMNNSHIAAENFRRNANLFACPVCNSDMHVSADQQQFCCVQGHSFDFARQGYLNLLLSNQRQSLQPGYDMATLRARKTILVNGLFNQLIDKLTQLVITAWKQQIELSQMTILDVGSGEGYLFTHIIEELQRVTAQVISAVGSDISKSAMQLAGQNSLQALWCICNLMRRIPFKDNAFSMLLNILAPCNTIEFQRILSPNGYFVKVLPLENHLSEIRTAIYEHARKESHSNETTMVEISQHFQLISREELYYQHNIGKELTLEILYMSPLYWKGKKTRISALLEEGLPKVTVNLDISLWQLRN